MDLTSGLAVIVERTAKGVAASELRRAAGELDLRGCAPRQIASSSLGPERISS